MDSWRDIALLRLEPVFMTGIGAVCLGLATLLSGNKLDESLLLLHR